MSDKSKITTQSTKNSSRIEELSSDYTSSSEESLKEHNLNNSGLNTSNDDFFHFNSNNNKNNNEKKDKELILQAPIYQDIQEYSSEYQILKRNVERSHRQGRLLLVSLLENFCAMYDQSPQINQQLFYVICKQLSKMGIIEEEDFMEELSSVRSTYKKAFKQLMIQALVAIREENIFSSRSLLMPPSADNSSVSTSNLDNIQSSFENSIHSFNEIGDQIKSHNILDLLDYGRSRYLDDFIQIRRLGKGAFGAVFEAENKLDGLRYAVKIIRIPSLKDLFIDKIINEVKFLARLDHKNVVRYYSAWLDNDSPIFVASDDDDEEDEDEDEDEYEDKEDYMMESNKKNNNNIRFIHEPFFIKNEIPYEPGSYSSRGIYIEELDSTEISDMSYLSSKKLG